jgi:hypothetical protein
MKTLLVYLITLLFLASCTTTKQGNFTSKAHYNNQSNMEVATSSPKANLEAEVIQPAIVNSDAVNTTINELQITVATTVEATVFSEIVTAEKHEPILTVDALRARMANDLRLEASTIDNKFAGRILNKTANKIEAANFNTKTKLTFFDKIKASLFAKLQAKFAARGGMAVADILAIVSLVTGILALGAFYGSFLLGLAAIITGAIALRKGTSRRIMAIVGIILGVVAMLFWSGWIFIF